MIVYSVSERTTILEEPNIDNINLFYQFFIHSNKERQEEIVTCLQNNVTNKYISNIYLLNERIYTDDELTVSSDKIIQVDIKRRLMFKDVFEYIDSNNIKGYNVIINADIFFDENIKNLFNSDIHINKKMYALLRYEYNKENINDSELFGDRGDSQDTWIIHSNFSIGKKESKIFNFEFGKPGCDNKMIYLMSLLGYEVLNDPEYIKSYHVHATNIRNYSAVDKINMPYEIIMPKNSLPNAQKHHRGDIKMLYNDKYNHKKSNIKLFEYIKNKLENRQNFIIPRIAGVENNYAILSNMLLSDKLKEQHKNILEYLNNNKNRMKNNAGIKLTTMESIQKYSQLYLESFKNCDLYAGWAPFDAVYNCYLQSNKIIEQSFKKETVYSEVFDIYHYVYSTPWTFALRGKRLLFISSFAESIQSKITDRREIYGVDLFPDCEIVTICPPQTQGDEESEEFDIELRKFTQKLDEIKDTYDIALVSCGGYGNLVCSHIYKSGKSAIYVGGVLQMYWGILGSRWFKNRPDVIRLFLNKYWTRPKDSEKPKNHENIENSCYW
jgi:hypothetical protein